MNTATLSPHVALTTRSTTESLWHRLVLWFFSTPKDGAGIVMRLGLALAMFPHGAQKALGWFGGWGFHNTVAAFTHNGMPLLLAWAVIAAEFLGSLALFAGFFTRWSAFGIGLVMLGAALTVHLPNGFFMNWMGNQKGEGIEYFVLAVALAVGLILHGGGKWSVDRSIAKRLSF